MGYSVSGSVVKDSEKLKILSEKGYAYKVTNGYAIIVEDSYANYHSKKNPQNIASILKSIGVEKYIEVEADYFGGGGDQHSIVHNLNDLSQVHKKSINLGLREIGVERTEEEDEFDIVGLGSIRDNEDVIPKEIKEERKKQEEIEKQKKEDAKYNSWKEDFLELSDKERLIKFSELFSSYEDSKPLFSNSRSDTDDRIFEYNEHLKRYLEEEK